MSHAWKSENNLINFIFVETGVTDRVTPVSHGHSTWPGELFSYGITMSFGDPFLRSHCFILPAGGCTFSSRTVLVEEVAR